MTKETFSTRDEKAKAIIEGVVNSELTKGHVQRLIVTPRENHSGEPAFYVTIFVDSEKDVPEIFEQNRLVAKMLEALEKIDDGRFPYLHFGHSHADGGKTAQTILARHE